MKTFSFSLKRVQQIPICVLLLLPSMPGMLSAQSNYMSIFGINGCSAGDYTKRLSCTSTPSTTVLTSINSITDLFVRYSRFAIQVVLIYIEIGDFCG